VQILATLVATTGAVALLPTLGRPESHPGVAVRPVARAELGRTISAFHRASGARSPALGALVAALEDAGRMS